MLSIRFVPGKRLERLPDPQQRLDAGWFSGDRLNQSMALAFEVRQGWSRLTAHWNL